ncbi:hypothetical protein MSG28_004126 [Choristoneura fumiferana]|uniref:Uncharacterized protein n=2 Tax=Choristoneura fumiferana TaxID=7141 RepID=A0ACC0KHM9_CHOFU|nr:hypothetical protein MSG28_004126 [Choristoneura fumiferana]KAI8435974.1 hypothetical protein MSG28_004126 [Choristoneura fumiferana]
MSNIGAADSWENQADVIGEQGAKDSNDVSTKFSTLNVNAVEFVPSFCMPSQANETSESPSSPQKSESGSTNSADSPVLNGCGERGDSGDGGAASASPRVEEPPPVPPAAAAPVPAPAAPPVPPDVSPTVDSWEAEADDALLTPEENNEPDEEEIDQQVQNTEDGELTKKVPKKKPPRVEDTRSKKEHVNVVFIGHVDAGKSTIGGQIMSLTGMVDKRTLDKYEREAREKSRESWYLSWALDTNQEERDKGKTVEVGRAYFETEKKHFTILDAPGHKSFVPNMIGGAAQADLAVLVISARKGEFETGFDRGGQTREHAMLAKTAGVKHLVALVNKMDDPTVNWDEKRYNECRDKILPYLKKLGFNTAKDLSFLPVSGQTGQGLLERVSEDICSWYTGPSFIQLIDELPSLNRKMDGPFIMPVVDKYKDMGTVLMGKVEAGTTRKGSTLFLMPNRVQVNVDQLWSDDIEVTSIGPGENVKVKLKGIEEEDVSPGFVLCDIAEPITTGRALICLVDKKTGDKSKTRPRFVKQDQVAIMRIECAGIICLEPFKKFAQMGRFTLRDENKTIAIGKVLKQIFKLHKQHVRSTKTNHKKKIINHDILKSYILEEFQVQNFNYSGNACRNSDDELKIITERNKQLVHEIKTKVEEYERQQIQYGKFKSARKDGKQQIFLQFFTEVKKESKEYSVQLLKDTNTKRYEVYETAYKGDFNQVKVKIDQEASLVTTRDSNDRLLIHWAALGGNENLVEHLIESGSPVDPVDDTNSTPLILAASAGRYEVVRLLIGKNANVNHKTNRGQTSLHYASSKGHKEIVKLLIEFGANVNEADVLHATPLHRAASLGRNNIVELLLSHNIKVDPQDSTGSTPFYLVYRILHALFGDNNYLQTKYRSRGHTWRSIQCNKSIPYNNYCTVCSKLMLPLVGLFCECCAVSACKRCRRVVDKKFRCKQFTWPADKPFHHHWVQTGTGRGDSTDSNEDLAKRFYCCWCQRTKLCNDSAFNDSEICDFQKYRNIIIPPACVQVEKGVITNIKPAPVEHWEPLFIFANRKSGSNRSDEVLSLFRGLLNPVQRRLRVRVDDAPLTLPPLQALVALNIPSWGAGVQLWNMGNDGDVEEQSIEDGKLEVAGISSSFHIARLQCGLAEPYRFAQASKLKECSGASKHIKNKHFKPLQIVMESFEGLLPATSLPHTVFFLLNNNDNVNGIDITIAKLQTIIRSNTMEQNNTHSISLNYERKYDVDENQTANRMSSDIISSLQLDKAITSNRVIVAKEINGCDSSFITSCILGHCIKNKQAVLLITTHNSLLHYQNVGLKMNYNLEKYIDSGLIKIFKLDEVLVNLLLANETDSLQNIFCSLNENMNLIKANNAVVNIIFDGVSHLFDMQHSLRDVTNELSSVTVSSAVAGGVQRGRLFLIDLAGSERAGLRARRLEGAHINRSLLALANCIMALSGGARYVNYRDSKLTRLLREVLGGRCRTAMVAHVAPGGAHRETTRSTLHYAQRASSITNKSYNLASKVKKYDVLINKNRKTKEEQQQLALEVSQQETEESAAHLKSLREAIVSTFKQQMRLRRRLMELDSHLLGLALDAERQHAAISHWEARFNRLYKPINMPSSRLSTHQSYRGGTGASSTSSVGNERAEAEVAVEQAWSELAGVEREQEAARAERDRVERQLEQVRLRGAQLEQELPARISSGPEREVLALVCRVHELEADKLALQGERAARAHELRRRDLALQRRDAQRRLSDEIITRQRRALEDGEPLEETGGTSQTSQITGSDAKEIQSADENNSEVPEPETNEEKTEVIDPDVLLILGDPAEEINKFGPEINENIASRWTPILKKGLGKEEKDTITKQYQVPSNCTLLQSPKLNPEINSAISDAAKNRDKKLESTQQQLGVGLTALGRAMTLAITDYDKEKMTVIKHMNNAARILTDLHFNETRGRKLLITPTLDKNFLELVKDVGHDEYLYGKNLSENIKTLKSIENSSKTIKKPEQPRGSAYTSSGKQKQGNAYNPPRYQQRFTPSPRGAARGGFRKPLPPPRRPAASQVANQIRKDTPRASR